MSAPSESVVNLTPYQKFQQEQRKQGKSMKEAALLWASQNSKQPTVTQQEPAAKEAPAQDVVKGKRARVDSESDSDWFSSDSESSASSDDGERRHQSRKRHAGSARRRSHRRAGKESDSDVSDSGSDDGRRQPRRNARRKASVGVVKPRRRDQLDRRIIEVMKYVMKKRTNKS
jgi:hypothetical protein